MGISLDAFNVICGVVTIAAFLLATVQYFLDRGFKRYLEKGLLALIGSLDKAAAMGEVDRFDKADVALLAESARDQTIGLLATFSNAQERLKTYNFGFTDEEVTAIVEKRKRALGLGVSGCILSGQHIDTPKGSVVIQDIAEGAEVLCRDADGKVFIGSAWGINKHVVGTILNINDSLKLTVDHKVYVVTKGYVQAADLVLGDKMVDKAGNGVVIFSLQHISGEFVVHTIETTGQNLFANGILVHNIGK